MAWPGDYIDWARRARPRVFRLVRSWLFRQLSSTRFSGTEIAGLASQATTEAFNLASGHRAVPGYFQDEAEFQRWLGTVTLLEVMGLLLRHTQVRPALRSLPVDQCRVLEIGFVDRLPDGDAAGFLGIPAGQVSQQRSDALTALFRLLR
jgi:DNA-directed RNA polymerase specialized sigma24 family protein